VDSSGDTVSEAFETGVDLNLQTDTVNSLVSFILGENVENLTLVDPSGTLDIHGAGNAADNIMVGTEGFNWLEGLDGNDQINGLGGNDVIFAGTGNDYIGGGSGHDTVYAGQGDDSLWGEDGDDVLMGGKQDDVLQGLNGNDILLAGQNHDYLCGCDGNDFLDGARGADTLVGGIGIDTFAFTTALGANTDSGVTEDNVDSVYDFTVGEDIIQLSSAIFTQLTQGNIGTTFVKNATGVAGAGQYLIYNTAAHTLSYDADANGAGAAVTFALDSSATKTMDAINASCFVIV
jgi:Ca2+-binding RTX toxin-like protein